VFCGKCSTKRVPQEVVRPDGVVGGTAASAVHGPSPSTVALVRVCDRCFKEPPEPPEAMDHKYDSKKTLASSEGSEYEYAHSEYTDEEED
jgi:hypothetical protein